MKTTSCPTSLVDAPLGVVWNLLTEPACWAEFLDIRISRIDPSGSAVVGQRIYAESGPRLLHLGVTLEYTSINASRRTIGLTVRLPLGITVRENLSCSAVSETQCQVNYHCDFGLPAGWRGMIARMVLWREIDAGPADSLLRLKRAAERRFSNVQSD
jgi:hypothetical protein